MISLSMEWITSLDTFRALEADWEYLRAQSPTNTVFQSFAWNLAWVESFSDAYKLSVLVLRDCGKTVGIAPLVSTTKSSLGVPTETLTLLGSDNYASDYGDFLFPADRPEVLEKLLFHVIHERTWKLLLLPQVPSESPTTTALCRALTPWSSLWIDRARPIEAPTRLLTNESLSAKLPREKLVKRKRKALEKLGSVSFETHTEAEEIEKQLPLLFTLHRKRWRATATPSQFHSPEQRLFYEQFVRELAPSHLLHLSVLRLNARPIALHLGFKDPHRFYWYKPAYDPELQKHSPGLVLLHEVMREQLSLGTPEFDFTIGDESYKYDYATQIRTVERTTIVRSVLHAHAYRIREVLREKKRAFQAQLKR